jgi:hypothetical protein
VLPLVFLERRQGNLESSLLRISFFNQATLYPRALGSGKLVTADAQGQFVQLGKFGRFVAHWSQDSLLELPHHEHSLAPIAS